jgi:uncharacterized protein (DUF1499 family)
MFRSPIRLRGSALKRSQSEKRDLPACSVGSQNCVSSKGASATLRALSLTTSIEEALESIKQKVLSLPGSTLVANEKSYLHFTVETEFFGFVDDLEFSVEDQVIHIRSASRLGRSDFGVNLKRLKSIGLA